MKVVPIGSHVVVQRTDATTTTTAGIVLPDAAQRRSLEGRILSVGDGRLLPDGQRAELQVSEGDRVLFSNYVGTEIRIDGQDVLIMNEGDILAVIS